MGRHRHPLGGGELKPPNIEGPRLAGAVVEELSVGRVDRVELDRVRLHDRLHVTGLDIQNPNVQVRAVVA